MEKLETLYEHVTERLRSPLIFSFIVSWLIANWRIPVILFWYSEETLIEHGFKDHISYIESILVDWRSWILPLLIAILYTFVYPLLRNLIVSYLAWAKKRGDKARYKQSAGSVIEIEKYREKVLKVIRREKELIELIDNESERIENLNSKILNLEEKIDNQRIDIDQERAEKREALQNFANQQNENRQHNEATQVDRLAGTWDVIIGERKVEWEISNNNILERGERLITNQIGHVGFIYWHATRNHTVFLFISLSSKDNPWAAIFPNGNISAKLQSNHSQSILVGETFNGLTIELIKIEKNK